MKQLSMAVILSIIVLSSTFQIKNINHDLKPQNSQQYVQYIKAIKGLSSQSDLSGDEILAKIVRDERISMLSSIGDVVLVLIDEIQENPESLDLLEEIKQLKGFDNLVDGFDVMSLADFDQETTEKKIKELQAAGNIVHTLEISQQIAQQYKSHTSRKLEEVSSESEIYEPTENSAHSPQPKTRNVKEGQLSQSYILKFFFSLIFIIVALGSLMVIANMDNKKDTLLYAKFIADVGAK